MRKKSLAVQLNTKFAENTWGVLSQTSVQALEELTERFQLSAAVGDLLQLDGKWYVTHSGLLRLAQRRHCSGIVVAPIRDFCDRTCSHWTFKAIVYKSRNSKGFVGYGDADPSNVSPLVRGAEMRVAETRAVNRALRKAYGIGLCSVEEIGSFSGPLPPASADKKGSAEPAPPIGHPLRDRLLLLIRQHQLNAGQVKRYATDFCGTKTLREASREQVEKFVNHLAQIGSEGRDKLLEQLAPYAETPTTESHANAVGTESNKEAA